MQPNTHILSLSSHYNISQKVDFTKFLTKFVLWHTVKQSLVNLLLFIITSSRKSFGEVDTLLALPPSDDRKLRCSGVDKFLKVE